MSELLYDKYEIPTLEIDMDETNDIEEIYGAIMDYAAIHHV